MFLLLIDAAAFHVFSIAFRLSEFFIIIYCTISAAFYITCIVYFNKSRSKNLQVKRQVFTGTLFLVFIPKLFLSLFFLFELIIIIFKRIANLVYASIFHSGELLFSIHSSVLFNQIAIFITAFLLLAFIYGSLFNVYNYQVRKVKLKLLKLPKVFHGLKVVQISDIHSGSLKNIKAVEKAVQKINALEPDLVLFTGDLVNNIATEAEKFVPVFSKIKTKYGVFSVLGNHDYGDYVAWEKPEDKIQNLQNLIALHQKMHWKLLMNEHVQIENDGEKIIIAGVENWSAGNRFTKYGKLDKALTGIPDDLTILLLSHDPSHWKSEILSHPAKIDLTFSGHTHGMQFGFELFGIKWSPVKYFYAQWAGLYQQSNQYLYVNRGFGVLGYMGRVGILPEITFFTLETQL